MRTRFLEGLLIACCLVPVIAGHAATRYVVPPETAGVSPLSPYTNWATAATNLLTVKVGCVYGDTIILSNGTYKLGEQVQWTVGGMTIKGLTTNARDVVVAGPYPEAQARCFYVNATNITIANMTISNGYVTTLGGAGLYIDRANTTLSNCIITCNVATNSNSYGAGVRHSGGEGGFLLVRDCLISDNVVGDYAGGLATLNASYATLSNCVIRNNRTLTSWGGGIGLASTSGTNWLYNCLIISNSAGSGSSPMGGGVYGNAPWRAVACWFEGNAAGSGSGCYAASGNTVISNCDFVCNGRTNANVTSGGACMAADGWTILNSRFVGNFVSAYGGGLVCTATGLVANCVFSNNVSGYSGGAIGIGNASAGNGGEVRNCLIVSNTASHSSGYGGGIWVYVAAGKTGVISSCTIARNRSGSRGGGLGLYSGSYRVTDSIICSNIASSAANGMEVYSPTADLSYRWTNNPVFIDALAGDYRLAKGSPCINAGTNLTWMDTATDLDGKPRVRSGTVDIGCYEYEPLISGTVITIR